MKKVLSSIIGLLIFCAGAFAIQDASAQNNAQFTPQQVKQIQSIVHDYLIKNPNVLVEVSQALQAKEMAKIEKEAKVKIKQNAQQIFADPNSPVVGNETGPVTLVEFFDYQCPHCKAMVKPLQKLIEKNQNVRVVFKQLPIFGANSIYAAKAALAVWKLDKGNFYVFNDALLNIEGLTPDKVKKLAKRFEIDVDKLEKTIKNDKGIQKQIDANLELAKKLDIRGTPTFIIGNWQTGVAASKNQTNLNPKLIAGAVDEAALEKSLKNNSSNSK